MDDGLAGMRRRYTAARLLDNDVQTDPFDQFREWLHEAIAAGLTEPNAMVLATASADGQPSTRTVLLKGLDDGFVFFTNHTSRKATELLDNPRASLCFTWFAMERQVIVCGSVATVSEDASRAYWASRPRESQISAWASRQSSVIGSREELVAAAAAVERKFPGDVPLPDFWGGFRVVPSTVEFWQGGPGRLHDRLRYRRAGEEWAVERLAP